MVCKLCHCPCFPSDYQCLMQYTPELRPIDIGKIESAIVRARLQYLAPLFGAKCLDELCTSITNSRANAITNHTDWKDELPNKWSIIVKSADFQTAYANAVYREYVIANSATATNDGIVQIARDTANGSNTIDTTTKHIDRNLRNDIINDLTRLISQAQQLFIEYVIKPNKSLYDCSIACCPCDPNPTSCSECDNGLLPKPKKLTFA